MSWTATTALQHSFACSYIYFAENLSFEFSLTTVINKKMFAFVDVAIAVVVVNSSSLSLSRFLPPIARTHHFRCHFHALATLTTHNSSSRACHRLYASLSTSETHWYVFSLEYTFICCHSRVHEQCHFYLNFNLAKRKQAATAMMLSLSTIINNNDFITVHWLTFSYSFRAFFCFHSDFLFLETKWQKSVREFA